MPTFPTNIGLNALTLKSVSPTLKTESRSFRRHTSRIPTHRWEAMIKTSPLPNSEFRDLWAFINSLEGSFSNFELEIPRYSTPRGSHSGTPLAAALTVGGSKTINVSGYTASITNIAKAGDLIKFAGHSKVYQITQDASSDINGDATLTLNTGLIEDVAFNEALTTNNVPFTFALRNDPQEFKASSNSNLISVELDLIEDF